MKMKNSVDNSRSKIDKSDFAKLIKIVERVCGEPMNSDSLDNFDAEVIELRGYVDSILKNYFRSEVRGIESIPDGRALIVGNHTGGIVFVSPVLFANEFYNRRGTAERLYFLAHNTGVNIPYFSNFLKLTGLLRADHDNARKALAAGHKVCVYPGGAHEAFRTFAERKKVSFGGHKGFARLAIEQNVPIVPVADVGGHETAITLKRGKDIARAFGLNKFFRVPTFPITIAAPWPIMPGPFFYFPLPAKIEVEVGDPIYPAQAVGGAADAEDAADRLYHIVENKIQSMSDAIYSRRKLPVIG